MRRAESLDLVVVFDGRILRPMDYVAASNGGEVDVPAFLASLANKGGLPTSEGWVFEYDIRAMGVLLKDEDVAPL